LIVEIINTGSELLNGRRLNLHQQWLCQRLARLGYAVNRQTSVADTGPAIETSVREALGRADLVITTGGLGPTADDLTRERIAGLVGRSLSEDALALENIRRFFQSRQRPMPERTRVQALVPEGALVLPNAHGTAPGLALHVLPNAFRADARPSWLIMLPGPPRELHPMFDAQVAPLLAEKLAPSGPVATHTLRTTGIGESLVEEKISGPLRHLLTAGLDLGLCGHPGEVEIHFTARGRTAPRVVAEAVEISRAELGKAVFADGEESLESVIVRQLAERKLTLALAESCTGGHLANRLTDVPGASAVLLAGLVTYSNAAKQEFLGVQSATLAQHGAVSEPVAREMAEGARAHTGADFALSVTGIAGPGGGTREKPVGTVYLGLATPQGTLVLKQLNPYDRETFKRVTSQQALDLLRRKLLGD
jgi:nicotinamide-nucleotide amidase